MGRPSVNLIGKQFGRLLVVEKLPCKHKSSMWLCWCVCGRYRAVQWCNLRSGHARSCGCYKNRHLSETQRRTRPKRTHEQQKIAQREANLRHKYGVDSAWIRRTKLKQGNACAICMRTGVKLCVDHNHKTGKARALLCSPCNFILGFCEEDPARFVKFMAYINLWETEHGDVEWGKLEDPLKGFEKVAVQ